MLEDKLTQSQRCRLEALAQAIAYNASTMGHKSTEELLDTANKFDIFIFNGSVDG